MILIKNSLWGTYCVALDKIAEDWPDTQLAKDWQEYRKKWY